MMRRPARAVWWVLAVGVVVLAGAVVLWTTAGDDPEEVATTYLEAHWLGEWRTECDLATSEWRRYLYEGFPFADCADYAAAADRAEETGSDTFAAYRDDVVLHVETVVRRNEGDRARIEYVAEFSYSGADRDGFEALWQGAAAVDRGTVELVEVDGDWRVAGVDGG